MNRFLPQISLLFALQAVFCPIVNAQQQTSFYVAPNGSDANAGSQTAPFATAQRARDAIRALKQRGLQRPVTVFLRGGTYSLAEPLVFTPQDSGTPSAPVTYAASAGETPILSGGTRLSGWKRSGKLWTTTVPGVREGTRPVFTQLWAGGERRFRARTPNRVENSDVSFFRVADPLYSGPQQLPEPIKKFQYAAGDIDPNWDSRGAEVVFLQFWQDSHAPVKGIDGATRTIALEKGTRFKTGGPGEAGARYFVENFRAALDAPGEWYLDAQSGELSYFPLPGETPENTVLIAPRLQTTVRFDGEPQAGRPVSHLSFRGVQFSHSDFQIPAEWSDPKQAAQRVPAMVSGRGVQNVAFENCVFRNFGAYGLELLQGSTGNRISRCQFIDGAAGGIQLNGGELAAPVELRTGNNVIEDCEIAGIGQIFPSAVGIFSRHSFGNRIAHNYLHDLPYSGISVGLSFNYVPTVSRDNVVEWNRIHDVVRLLDDGGAIYTQGQMPGTVIRHNLIHDVGHHKLGIGIYLDGSTSNVLVENNLVYNCTNFPFHQSRAGRGKPKNNLLRNNIFALGGESIVRLSDTEENFSAFHLERSILLSDGSPIYGSGHNSRVANPAFTTDSNLIWDIGGPLVIARDSERPWMQNPQERFGQTLTLEAWRAKGLDRASVIADPLFADPKKGDFSLRAGSPALMLGFVPFDLREAGIRPSDGKSNPASRHAILHQPLARTR